jgi:hypothetical protein
MERSSRPSTDTLRQISNKASALFFWRLPQPRPIHAIIQQVSAYAPLVKAVLCGDTA